jgi:excisionase family DNA binding protein
MNRSELNSLVASENRYVSTAQVARALGVSVTTVKRWVDSDILPAHRTAGGHRKLLLADILRLAREENLPQADLASLVSKPQTVDLDDPRAIYEQLLRAVSELDVALVSATLHGAYQNGYSIETLADRVISPVMVEVGHDWEAGRIDVSHEHRATQAVVSALYELKASLRGEPVANGPLAVGGAPEHDHYILASLLCDLVLMDAGWEVVDLGPHTPISAFLATAERLKPRLIWISVSHLRDADRFVSEYRDLYRLAEERGVAIALGGRALTDSIRQRFHYTTFGDGLTQLASFARTLYRPPTLPRRGRPRGTRGTGNAEQEETPSGPLTA